MLWQLILNGIIAGATVALMAIGFALVYNVARFFNFAHGVVFTAGAYFVFLLNAWMGLPFPASIFLATVLCALLGCALDLSVFRRLRRRGSPPLVLLLASLGIYIVLQNVISVVFGDDTKTIRSEMVEEGITVLGAKITLIQILIICVSTILVVAVTVLLKTTKMGRAMRAVGNDPELAKVSGIESDKVVLWAFAVGSALAGVAGILVALDVDMRPGMGMNALMMAVVAVIIGGVDSIPGVALGALLLGIAMHVGVWKISSQWQEAIAFLILLGFLLFRPEGFLGKRLGKATM